MDEAQPFEDLADRQRAGGLVHDPRVSNPLLVETEEVGILGYEDPAFHRSKGQLPNILDLPQVPFRGGGGVDTPPAKALGNRGRNALVEMKPDPTGHEALAAFAEVDSGSRGLSQPRDPRHP